MSSDKINHMLLKFNFTFTWEYVGEGEIRQLLPDVFRVLEEDDERSLEQVLISCVHQAYQGLTLSQPNNDLKVPYEMKFVVHPPHESFCITKIVFLSEARNLELYVNGGYEKSARGIMLTLNKERKLSLFEAQFDLSGYVETKSNATIKFLSHPCQDHMKLQAVVIKVEKCKPISSIEEEQSFLQLGGPVNLSSVKRYLGSVGRPLSSDAQKMLQSIEDYQKSPAFKAQQMLSSPAALSQNLARSKGTEAVSESLTSQVEEKELSDEERHHNYLPEQDQTFMKMLEELGLKDENEMDHQSDTTSSPQARWAAYLQSRVRASRTSPQSSSEMLTSTSLDGYSGANGEHRGKKTRQHGRPSSIGCVGEGGLDRSQVNPDALQQKWLQDRGHSQRCEMCGCPGCISVFNSISTSIFAVEKRILEKVDEKMTQLREDLNTKFEMLFHLLDKRQVINDEED